MLINKEMLDYFKGEKEFYEFALLFTDGKRRMDLLEVSYGCYSSKKTAKKWYDGIINKIENPKAIEKLDILYSDMTR